MAKTGEKVLRDTLRTELSKKVFDFLDKEGEDVGFIASNKFNFPCVDAEGNEYFCEVTVSIPTGGKKEDYDGYDLRDEYKMKLEKKAAREKEKEKK